MRLSASRIRSINRAIARAQLSAWPTSARNSRHSTANPSPTVPVSAAKFVKVVAVPRRAAA
jgi:hypothetical protein